ncbi:MAG: ATP-binding protein [Minwuiales bacterium]|nr:ATP-binding protein [Minwuiales bacterium]
MRIALSLPKSISAQTLIVMGVGLVVSHFLGLAIYSLDRKEVVMTTEAVDVAERIAGVVVLLNRLPKEWRKDVVRGSDSRSFSVALADAATAVGVDRNNDLTVEVAQFLQGQLTALPADGLLVGFAEAAPNPPNRLLENMEGSDRTAAAPVSNGGKTYDYLYVSTRLEDGQWLNFAGAIPRPQEFWSGIAGAYIFSVALGVGVLTMWLVVRVTAPLSAFASAADRLGRNIRAEPLSETGPTEVVQASRAFNEMQERLRRLVENRTQMLAAISHDLRTPVTLLRLRAELMADGIERTKVLDTLDEMEAMIASVLEFAKGTFHDEPERLVDLSALVGSLCDDMADAGARIEFDPPDRLLVTCRRTALKRALMNVIDNAVKYGDVARVAIESQPDAVEIVVDDDGPGIPQQELDQIFMPFYRVDRARTPGKGGVGLGLSIAQSIVHGHGGTIRPENRPGGGLRVRISLPK